LLSEADIVLIQINYLFVGPMLQYLPVKKYLWFLLLVALTVYTTYFTPAIVSSVWYVVLLVMYFNSKDEAFWLAFFFVTTDGFMGFLGIYTVVLKAIPGLPGVELAQFYIILSLIKVLFSKNNTRVFYRNWMLVLLLYSLFLVMFGMMNGLDSKLNVYFRVVKITLPFLLFYTVPRLLKTVQDYERLFGYLFLVLILAFVAQLNTLFTGFDPKKYFRLINPDPDADEEAELEVGRNFRVLYNQVITMFCLFGALYFLVLKRLNTFKDSWLYLVIVLCFALAFLSATRGFILSFGFIIFLFFVFVQRLNLKRVFAFSFLFIALLLVGLSNKKVSTQIQFSIDRLLTLNSLAEGDISAGGTLIRLSERGPRVMKAWSESPVLGAGFSNYFFKNSDFHVGNQNILFHAGVVGFLLLCGFIVYFIIKMLGCYFNASRGNPFSSTFLVFVIFLAGWIIVHSTSGQQFAFYGLPNDIFPQAIFLSLAGLTYREYKMYQAT
jgi:hypothetical protein